MTPMHKSVSLAAVMFLLACVFLGMNTGLAPAQTPPEPQPPLGAAWNMSLKQVQELDVLDRNSDGSLQHSHLIHANSQEELVTRWQDQIVTFLFGADFGLYAVGIETIPWTVQHTLKETDIEIRDMKYSAPVRVAVAAKYGPPDAVGVLWSTEELTPLAENRTSTISYGEASLIDWDYGRSWLIWQGHTTRLALGDQSVWYASQEGLAYRAKIESAHEQESQDKQAEEEKKDAERERRLQYTRQQITAQAKSLEDRF